jgi:hypothetical protein
MALSSYDPSRMVPRTSPSRVALIALLFGFCSSPVLAQSAGLVVQDGAIIWRSDAAIVAATTKDGTPLEITARSDFWYEVVVPASLGGQGERGLIARRQVALVALASAAGIPCRGLREDPCSAPERALVTQVQAAIPLPEPRAPQTIRQPDAVQQPPFEGSTRTGISTGVFVHFGGGGTDAPAAAGGALVGGMTVGVGRVFASFTPADLILYSGDTGPYYTDTFSNGQSRCRDSRNGQFAADVNCIAVETSYAFSVDPLVLVPRTPLLLRGGDGVSRMNGVFGSARREWAG